MHTGIVPRHGNESASAPATLACKSLEEPHLGARTWVETSLGNSVQSFGLVQIDLLCILMLSTAFPLSFQRRWVGLMHKARCHRQHFTNGPNEEFQQRNICRILHDRYQRGSMNHLSFYLKDTLLLRP